MVTARRDRYGRVSVSLARRVRFSKTDAVDRCDWGVRLEVTSLGGPGVDGGVPDDAGLSCETVSYVATPVWEVATRPQ